MVRAMWAVALVAVVLLALAPAAGAQEDPYGGEVPNVISGGGAGGAGAGGGSGSAGSVASGSLPFTGLDLALITTSGVALLGTGIALRMRGRRAEN